MDTKKRNTKINKTEVLSIKVTPEEKQAIKTKADQAGMTISKYVLSKAAYKQVYITEEKMVDILDV